MSLSTTFINGGVFDITLYLPIIVDLGIMGNGDFFGKKNVWTQDSNLVLLAD